MINPVASLMNDADLQHNPVSDGNEICYKADMCMIRKHH